MYRPARSLWFTDGPRLLIITGVEDRQMYVLPVCHGFDVMVLVLWADLVMFVGA